MSIADTTNAFKTLMNQQQFNNKVGTGEEEVDVDELERQLFGAGSCRRVLNWADEEEDDDDLHPAFLQRKIHSSSNDSSDTSTYSVDYSADIPNKSTSSFHHIGFNSKSFHVDEMKTISSRLSEVTGLGVEAQEEGWTVVKSKTTKKGGNIQGQNDKRKQRNGTQNSYARQNSSAS